MLPTITIVIITLNNARTIKTCMESIAMQDYPKNLIQYLNIDGGSTDKTREVIKSYGFETILSPIKKNAEAQRAIGLAKAKNELIVSLDADNYLPYKSWLKKMINPFMDDSKIVHAGTLHYSYRKNDKLFNRYCALFGNLDPVVFYIGHPDRKPRYATRWTGGKILKESNNYTVVDFNKENLPTVGCNGVVYRRDILKKFAKSNPKDFMHIDVFVDLLNKGFTRFAIVNLEVIHDTAVTMRSLIQKRLHFLTSYYLNQSNKRRYLIYNPQSPKDNLKLFLFVVYTLTVIKPLADSFYGYFKIRDFAWFLHPMMCWIYLLAYGFSSAKNILNSKIK